MQLEKSDLENDFTLFVSQRKLPFLKKKLI